MNQILDYIAQDYFVGLPDDVILEIQKEAHERNLQPLELVEEEFSRLIQLQIDKFNKES